MHVAKRGPKPKLSDPAVRQKLLDVIEEGLSRRKAAALVRIAVSTIENTAKRDPAFAEDLDAAEAQRTLRLVRIIHERKPGWQAAAWFLERTEHETFALKRPEIDSHGPDEKAIKIRRVVTAAPSPDASLITR